MHKLWLAIIVICCWVSWPTQASTTVIVVSEEEINRENSSAQILLWGEQLTNMLTQQSVDIDRAQYTKVANVFGQLVTRGQELEAEMPFFIELHKLSEKLYTNCHNFIKNTENNLNTEAALEQLYRSNTWYDIHYALASFRYWQAWINLSIARLQTNEDDRAKWLSRAEGGFKAASVRILYPEIVYGSWMGMSYVALAQGDKIQAKKRLETLFAALETYPNKAFREAVALELALLEPKHILLSNIVVNETILNSGAARLAIEQAFALLDKYRNGQDGVIEAAQLLKPVFESRWLSNELLHRLMSYVDEIVSQDIGILGLIIDSEYAYKYKQYHTVVLKYREFMQRNGGELPLNFAYYQYHFVISLYKVGLHQDAAQELIKIEQHKKAPEALHNALIKLKFIIADSLYKQHESVVNSNLLVVAAQDYIAAIPKDENVAAAHLILARFGTDKQFSTHLALASSNIEYRTSASQVRLQRALDKFQKVELIVGSKRAINAANNILQALHLLPQNLQHQPENSCLLIQMNTVLMKHPEQLLQQIYKLEESTLLTDNCRQKMAWSKLRVLISLKNYQALSTLLENTHSDIIMQQQIFILLRELKIQHQTVPLETLAAMFVAELHSTPNLFRKVQLMRIDNMQLAQNYENAFTLAKDLLQQFPKSGDAWLSYSKAAELAGQLDSATRGWAYIAAAQAEGSPKWLHAMLQRAELAISQKLPLNKVCVLLNKIQVYKHLLDEVKLRQFVDLRQVSSCSRN